MAFSIRTMLVFGLCSYVFSVPPFITLNGVEIPLYRTDIGTDDEIFALVKASCPSMSMMCPYSEYAINAPRHKWNREKVMASRGIEVYKLGAVRKPDEKEYFRAFFCCTNGPCMEECGIYQKEETQLVKDFPWNVEKIFALGLEGLKPLEKDVKKYVSRIGDLGKRWRKPYQYPAEIEEYFDWITRNNILLVELLEAQKLRDTQ